MQPIHESLPERALHRAGAGFGRRLAAIGLVGLALRVAICLFAEQNPDRFDYPDSHRYARVAMNIAAGRGPIDDAPDQPGYEGLTVVESGTDPLYPILMAIGAPRDVSRVGSRTAHPRLFLTGRIINVATGFLAVMLVGLLARDLFGDGVGLVAATIMAIDPTSIYFTALVLTETAYVALLIGGLFAITRVVKSPRHIAWAMIAGAALGLATCMRSSGLLLHLGCAVFIAVRISDRRDSAAAGAVPVESPPIRRAPAVLAFLVCQLAMLAPTTYRNDQLFHRVIPVRTGVGASLLEGLGPWADGGPGLERVRFPRVPATMNEAERDRVYVRVAREWAVAHPSSTLRLAWSKAARMWAISPHAAGFRSTAYVAIAWLGTAPVYVLALAGVWLSRRRPRAIALLLAPAACYTLLHAVFVGSLRYRVPVMPGLFILAAIALVQIGTTIATRRPGARHRLLDR